MAFINLQTSASEDLLTSDSNILTVGRVAPATETSSTIMLYQCTAEPNRVDKSSYLSASRIVQGSFNQPLDVVNPVIRIEWDSYPTFNYCWIITNLNRKYFIDNIVCISKKQYELHLSLDVLYTYKSYISNMIAVVERQENNYNAYLNDTLAPVQANDSVEFIECTYGTNGNVFTTMDAVSALTARNYVINCYDGGGGS